MIQSASWMALIVSSHGWRVLRVQAHAQHPTGRRGHLDLATHGA